MTLAEERKRLAEIADEVQAIADKFNRETPPQLEAFARAVLWYDLRACSNVIRKVSRRLGIPAKVEEEHR